MIVSSIHRRPVRNSSNQCFSALLVVVQAGRRSAGRRRSGSRGKSQQFGNGNGDAGRSYTPAKTAFPPTETHKGRAEWSGFPCTDSFLSAIMVCPCLLLFSIKTCVTCMIEWPERCFISRPAFAGSRRAAQRTSSSFFPCALSPPRSAQRERVSVCVREQVSPFVCFPHTHQPRINSPSSSDSTPPWARVSFGACPLTKPSSSYFTCLHTSNTFSTMEWYHNVSIQLPCLWWLAELKVG